MSTTKYNYVCSGYLIENEKILLVLHNVFKKWVPPGGHIEDDETFAQTAEREFVEETGIEVRALSSGPVIHLPDNNATPLQLPFYTDLLVEGFKKPTISQYYYVQRTGDHELVFDTNELDDARWFSLEELDEIETFDQVRSLSKYALLNYPNKQPLAS